MYYNHRGKNIYYGNDVHSRYKQASKISHHVLKVYTRSSVKGNLEFKHDNFLSHRIDDHKLQRFFNAYSTESVKMIRLKDNIFVALNSMAFEGDNCDMCQEAEDRLREIATSLNCAQVILVVCRPRVLTRLSSKQQLNIRPTLPFHYSEVMSSSYFTCRNF